MKDLLPGSSYAGKRLYNKLEIGCLLYCIAELNKGSS